MRPEFTWRLRTRTLALGGRTLVMGVLNVTPDSFSDSGQFYSLDHAVGRAGQMLDEGADIVDIGGESTRPGRREPVTEQMELDRVMPVLELFLRERPDAVVSVDTYRASVARAAALAGAEIINDVSGFTWDPALAAAAAELDCGVVLMHMRGRPEEWRSLPPLVDPVATVISELRERAEAAMTAGVARGRIVLDPGFGFGKNFEENYPLLARFHELAELGFPLLSGTSRKSFIGRALARDGQDAAVTERLYGSVASAVMAAMRGAHIVRVHDVKPTVDALRLVDAVLAGSA